MNHLSSYLKDPFLNKLYGRIRRAGPIRSISVDITEVCNLRCTGCYYFEEGMDAYSAQSEDEIDRFIETEVERGTNFVTVVGGEPSLRLDRLKKLYDNFKINVATNGLKKIPNEGFSDLPIGVAIWGDHQLDSRLRGNGKTDLFSKALDNYYMDSRAFWYYTVAPGYAHQIENVVSRCIENGNRILFNYYSDLSNQGGKLNYKRGFEEVKNTIDLLTGKYPDKILTTPYLNEVVAGGALLGVKWGYEVCTNLSENYRENHQRFKNGKAFNPHFRAYNADFQSTRRCCTGVNRDCGSCFDTWEHFSWIMINMRKHLQSKEDFTNWLTTVYSFYSINKLIPQDDWEEILPHINQILSKNTILK